MAGRDLRALFSSNDRGLDADEAFTNRQLQWQAVTDALTAHQQHTSGPDFDVEDLESGRRNVLVFHGVGGIGKSTLSRKIEAALAHAEHRPPQWGAPAWPAERLLPVRIDLARSAGADFEQIVLCLRLAVASLGRPMPAFDLVLRRYWEHNHPGEPLDEYVRRGGLLSRFTNAVALPQQIQSALADAAQALALPGTVGGALSQLTGSLVTALRERRQAVRALAGCSRLADLLEADPDLDTLSFAAHLLAWDLAQLPADKAVLPVILFDTWEDTGDRTHRDLERLLQRIVWLMPNALFIISGRNRLQWADPALGGQLDWTGPNAWPDLAAPAPAAAMAHRRGARQILIGDFSAQDCEDHLARRLSRGGQPLIGADLRAVITARSHGLPLALDLAVMRFLEIRRSGRRPEPDDFGDFPALIARTLADLTPDERHVLRSVSLLDAFSVPLATQAAGLAHEAAALRLSERPFIREIPTALWPFHLHQVVRSAIRHAADHTDDRWSEQDWRRAAERALAALGQEWSTGARRDRALLIGCLRQGLALAADFRLELDWLTEAAFTYVGDSVWEPLAPPERPGSAGGLVSASDALVELLSALTRRQHEHRSRTADRLTAVIDSGLLPQELHQMALYYRAKALRDIGQSTESRRGYQQVADGGGRLAPAARRGLAQAARLAGDFPTAFAAAQTLGWEGRHQRVLGDLWWVQGEPARAAAAYLAGRTEAEQHATSGEAAHNQALRALAVAFLDPGQADDELDLAQQLLAGLDLRATGINAAIGALIRDAGNPALGDRVRTLRTEIDIAGLTSSAPTLELALAFHQAVLDDQDGLAATIDRLREQTRGGDYTYYTDIASFMAGLPLPADHTPPRWLDGDQATRARWRALVTARRDLLHTGR
ncbi:ATP/GTP-binding protein [Streptomyces lasiicapitis]|uniref:ATP/GTP-binding protein n=1 Tax=Streptomyces lasiicapitis TaxID=1923961 RepID=A0ABQ2MU57_9ACTN|nr:ATP/GTP-binding protein [Streptomyces lasiicapitis]